MYVVLMYRTGGLLTVGRLRGKSFQASTGSSKHTRPETLPHDQRHLMVYKRISTSYLALQTMRLVQSV